MDSWFKLSYTKRLYLWLVGYSLLLVGCCLIFQYHREKQFKISELNSQLQLVNKFILNELAKGKQIVQIDLTDFHTFDGLRISVINGAGNVLYDNCIDSLPNVNHLYREEISEALDNGSGYTIRRHSESTGDTYFYSASKDENGYIVRTAVPYSISLSTLLKADYRFLWIMGIITLVMCVIGYFATKRMGQNISRLTEFAESAEKGERISDTEPFPHDELGDISNHIVRLYANLQKATAERDREHRTALHEQREKERIKKQLTNNINHELKTPVASIQVCVETLLSHKNLSEEKKEDFLKRCLANTERLKRLLNDVSLITRMDDGGNAIVKRKIDLAEIISEVVTESLPVADSKGIEIVNGVTGTLPMTGNPGMLSSVFQNLIDNAIAYSGGTQISITLKSERNNKIEIVLADNGSGVPEEDLQRIFERFYRIDKGRSRAAGGTGLGLSIVKNAIMLHGGSIVAKNRPNGGLAMTIILSVDS